MIVQKWNRMLKTSNALSYSLWEIQETRIAQNLQTHLQASYVSKEFESLTLQIKTELITEPYLIGRRRDDNVDSEQQSRGSNAREISISNMSNRNHINQPRESRLKHPRSIAEVGALSSEAKILGKIQAMAPAVSDRRRQRPYPHTSGDLVAPGSSDGDEKKKKEVRKQNGRRVDRHWGLGAEENAEQRGSINGSEMQLGLWVVGNVRRFRRKCVDYLSGRGRNLAEAMAESDDDDDGGNCKKKWRGRRRRQRTWSFKIGVFFFLFFFFLISFWYVPAFFYFATFSWYHNIINNNIFFV